MGGPEVTIRRHTHVKQLLELSFSGSQHILFGFQAVLLLCLLFSNFIYCPFARSIALELYQDIVSIVSSGMIFALESHLYGSLLVECAT